MPKYAKNIISYFHGPQQNQIPLYQRPYKWSEENWAQLWEDILESDAVDSPHFLGAIVSMPLNPEHGTVSKFLIIDGQQRLTTVAILLCALREVVEKKVRSRIDEDLLVNRHALDDEPNAYLKLLPTSKDVDAYTSLVLNKNSEDSDSNIRAAYAYFLRQLDPKTLSESEESKGLVPADILQKVEKALKVVSITLDDDDDPYEIFASLNGKGEPLQASDLIRNFILMKFKPSDVKSANEQDDIYNKLWKPLENSLGDSLTAFLFHYSRLDGAEVKRQKVYKTFREKRKNISSVQLRTELEEMVFYGGIYTRLINPGTEPDMKLRHHLQVLSELKVTTFYPIILRLYAEVRAKKITETDLIRALEIVESFVVRRAVCNVKNNAIDKLVAGILQKWNVSDPIGWIHESLSNGARNLRWPKDEEFRDCFINDSQYGRVSDQTVLWVIDATYAPKEWADGKNVSVEHILPQALTPQWMKYLGEEAKSVETWMDTFGNLTITGLNQELGTKSFDEKKKIYEESRFRITQQITKEEVWNIEAIKRRGAMLAAKAIKIWSGPLEQKTQ